MAETESSGMKPKLSEHDIQSQILDWLKAKHIFHWRANTGSSGPMFHNGKRRFVRFGPKGCPDIFAVIGGRLIGIEVKVPGNEQSEHQRWFEAELVNAGGIYFIANSLKDAEWMLESIDDHGLPMLDRAAANAKAPSQPGAVR